MTLTPEMILAAAALATLAIVTALYFRQARSGRKLKREHDALQELVAHVRREAHSAVAYGSDVGKRLRKAEKDLATLTERLGQIEMRGESGTFERAINVARQGVDAKSLASNFGISRGEAELMSVVYGKRAAAR